MGSSGAALRLKKRLREEMAPTTDAAVWSRVSQELSQRGGFEPLMGLFPGVRRRESSPPEDSGDLGSSALPWTERDREMSSLVGKTARMEKRAAATR